MPGVRDEQAGSTAFAPAAADPHEGGLAEARACIEGMRALTSLSTTWVGATGEQIAESLLDALASILRPVFAVVRLNDGVSEQVERVRTPGAHEPNRVRALARSIGSSPTDHAPGQASVIRDATADPSWQVVVHPLGDAGELGVLAVGFEGRDTVSLLPGSMRRTLLETSADLVSSALRHSVRKQHAVRMNDERLQRAQRAAHLGTWDWNLSTDATSWSEGMYELLGVPPGSLDPSGSEWLEFVVPEDRASVLAAVADIRERGGEFELEFRVRTGQGVRWIASIGRVEHEGGVAVRMHGVNVDVTTLKRAEGRLQLLMDAVPALIGYVDAQACHRFANRGYEEWFGVRRRDLVGTSLRTVVGERDYARLRPHVEAALAGSSVTFETELEHRDGTTRFVLAHYVPEVLPDGSVEGFCTLVTDISERRQMEASLRESESRLQIAKHAARLGIHDFDVRAGTIHWDERVRELWGVPGDEPITYETWLSGVHPDDRTIATAAVDSALEPASDGTYRAEYRVVGRDGVERWVEATGHVTFSNAEPVRLVGTVEDITEHKRAEQALIEADRRKDEFLATLAHELRNPLAPIRMAAQNLRMRPEDPAVVEEATSTIERQSAHLVRLIDDLLDIGRITHGKVVLRKEAVDLVTVMQGVLENTRSSCEARELKLELELPEAPVVLEADPVRVAQIVGNLLSNACKHAGFGGRITVRAEQYDEMVLVRVRDDGTGLASDQLTKIFEMFAQIEGPVRAELGGLGIGLPLARALAQLHGGSLEAHSEGIGRGSEFVLRLPATRLEHDALDRPPSPASRGRARVESCRVLAVDDFEDALDSVALFLEFLGHEVHTARSGHDALVVLDERRPEVVLLDIGLPDIDGYEVARRIRSRPWGRDLLLVAVTGWGQDTDKSKAADAGFDLHLTKPVDPQRLERLLAERR